MASFALLGGRRILRVAITGGPCGGKTMLMSRLMNTIPKRTGYKVFCVPETATLYTHAGVRWEDMTTEKTIRYQLSILRTQMALESNMLDLAAASDHQNAMVVVDRGTMDGKAFCTEDQFEEVMKLGGYTTEMLLCRYDVVVHLVSCAIGAQLYYNYDNVVRRENVEVAIRVDERLQEIYRTHPCRCVIGNDYANCDEKLRTALNFIVLQCKLNDYLGRCTWYPVVYLRCMYRTYFAVWGIG